MCYFTAHKYVEVLKMKLEEDPEDVSEIAHYTYTHGSHQSVMWLIILNSSKYIAVYSTIVGCIGGKRVNADEHRVRRCRVQESRGCSG